LIASAVPVIRLLSYAYDVPVKPSPRLSPLLPDWTIRERYDIEANIRLFWLPPTRWRHACSSWADACPWR
jgi:hypothetical protein